MTNDALFTTKDSFAETNDASSTTKATFCMTNAAFDEQAASFSKMPVAFEALQAAGDEPKDDRLTRNDPPHPNHRGSHDQHDQPPPSLVGHSQAAGQRAGAHLVRQWHRQADDRQYICPHHPLAAVSAAVGDLQTAETAALARTKGAVATRNDKRAALVVLLTQLRGYIQTTADSSAENGAAIIESAGVAVRKTPTRRARAFAAKPGAVSGTAKVVAKTAGRRASYEWQYSTDGGKTWIIAPVTLQAKTTIAGLAPGATVLFKCRPVTRAGEGDWSQPASLVIS
jgi:hypothetical protein